MNPTRSAKSTEHERPLARGGDGCDGTLGPASRIAGLAPPVGAERVAAWAIGAAATRPGAPCLPCPPRSPRPRESPHRARFVPHDPQNRCPGGLAVPQFGQPDDERSAAVAAEALFGAGGRAARRAA